MGRLQRIWEGPTSTVCHLLYVLLSTGIALIILASVAEPGVKHFLQLFREELKDQLRKKPPKI